MKSCLENLDLSLPILDKIYSKTLCLQDYHLGDGNCRGLAEACEFLDTTVVNRMLFNNCGLVSEQLALILGGVAKMKDFKALILRQCSVNSLSLEKLLPLFEKPIPNHMEELSLIDCKINATQIDQLCQYLQGQNRIKKFALVGCSHSDKSFD